MVVLLARSYSVAQEAECVDKKLALGNVFDDAIFMGNIVEWTCHLQFFVIPSLEKPFTPPPSVSVAPPFESCYVRSPGV